MQPGIRNCRVILAVLALMTLGAGFMGIYGSITQLDAWQVDPGSVVVALLLSILLVVGGGCLLQRGIKYQGHAT
jgi:hypothetical protein